MDDATEDDRQEPDAVLGRLKSGIDYGLEEMADEMLAQAKRDKVAVDDDYEVLSPGQLDRRRGREIYNQNGTPEVHLFSGLYRRAYNPRMRDRPQKNEKSTDALEW